MRLTHYSPRPLLLDRARRYSEATEYFKPDGLWLSDEHGDPACAWSPWWAENLLHPGPHENHGITRSFRHWAEFWAQTTTDSGRPNPRRVLHLCGEASLDRFRARYERSEWNEFHQFAFRGIDCEALRRDFAGLLITPYDREYGYAADVGAWYLAWDCSSGVVWRLEAVRQLASGRTAMVSFGEWHRVLAGRVRGAPWTHAFPSPPAPSRKTVTSAGGPCSPARVSPPTGAGNSA